MSCFFTWFNSLAPGLTAGVLASTTSVATALSTSDSTVYWSCLPENIVLMSQSPVFSTLKWSCQCLLHLLQNQKEIMMLKTMHILEGSMH